MLHKTTEISDDPVLTESSEAKDCDDDYQEQGYLWLCAACEDHPTFESIYQLFNHKKTHDKSNNKTITSCESLYYDNQSERDGALEISKTDFNDANQNVTNSPSLNSPAPSCSSEDIPLARLLLDDSKLENFNFKPNKKTKKNIKKAKTKNSSKLKIVVAKVIDETETVEEKVIDNSEIETENIVNEKSNDLEDTIEEKENHKTPHNDSFISDNFQEKETDDEEESKEESKEEKTSVPATKQKLRHFCKICSTEFTSRFDLSAHKKTHLFEDTGCFKCETCGKMCPKYDNFTRHLSIHIANRQKNHQCPQCFASFYYYADLKRHLVLHLSAKPYKCEHCGEGFVNQDNLLIHEYKHTGIQYKKFACKDCDKVLNSPSALVMHAKTHSEKTVFCTEPGCKFSCYLQSQLRQHIRKHSGEKPYQCAKCGRCFARSNDMKNHNLNIHEGIKPYKCSSCPKKFALIGNLKNHKITHTNERPFLCAHCGKSFNHSSTLRNHSDMKHNSCKTTKSLKG